MVLFFTHIPFVAIHTFNATPPERLQQHPLLFTTNRTDRTFFVWRLNSVEAENFKVFSFFVKKCPYFELHPYFFLFYVDV